MFTYAKIFSLCLIVMLSACLDKAEPVKNSITIKTPSGVQAVFSVDIAKTPAQQQKGLMFVEEMADDTGMIFTYNQPSITKFWMKNTLIPLDMLFFDASNHLVHIEKSAKPHDETPRGPDVPICSVLEINGGLAEKLNIDQGSKLLVDFSQECLQSPNN